MKRILAFICAAAMAISLCACGGSTPAADPNLGEYTAFAIEIEGYLIDINDFDMTSVLTLEADGKGYLTISDEGGDVTDWSVDGENISVTSGVSTMTGTAKDGIIILDYDTGLMYYAKEGADISKFEVQTFEEIMNSIDVDEVEADAEAVEEEVEEAESGSTGDLPSGFDPNIKSDDSHFVMEMLGVTMVYEYEGDKIISLYGFINAGSEEMANESKEAYEDGDESVDSVEVAGSYIIIHYNEKAYKDLSLTSLEAIFKDSKVE